MRQLLLISIVGIHLLGNTEISQVFKLPNLVEHYFEHHRLNNHLSFFEFLAEHYGGDDGTHADDHKDSQLPCHDLNHNTLSVVCFEIKQDTPFLKLVTFHGTKANTRPLLTGLPSKHSLAILQPPRYVC